MRHRVRIRGLALYLCSGNWQCQYIKLIGLVSVCCTLCSRKDAINLREATALCLSSSPPSPLPICLMLAHKQTGADPGPWERRSMKVKYRRKRSIRKYTLSTIYHGWRGERIEIWMFAQSKYYIYITVICCFLPSAACELLCLAFCDHINANFSSGNLEINTLNLICSLERSNNLWHFE